MNRYHETIRDEAKKVLDGVAEEYAADKEEHGGVSERPNMSLWLDRTGHLAKHVEKIAKKWTKKDLLWVKENSRQKIGFGDLGDNAYGAFYKDILFELKKLMKKV